MKIKTVLIGVMVGLVVVATGFLIYLSIKNPELLTKVPGVEAPQPAGEAMGNSITVATPSEEGESQAVVPVAIGEIPVSGDCLIFEQSVCGIGKEPLGEDGKILSGAMFSVRVGTKLFAPFNGSVGNYYFKSYGGAEYRAIAIADITPWDAAKSDKLPAHRIDIVAEDFAFTEGLGFGSSVKKGQLIGEFRSITPIMSEMTTTQGNVLVFPSPAWIKVIPVTIIAKDSNVYLKSVFSMIK